MDTPFEKQKMKFNPDDPLSSVSKIPARGYLWRILLCSLLLGVLSEIFRVQGQLSPQGNIVFGLLSSGLMLLVYWFYVHRHTNLSALQSLGEKICDWRLLLITLPMFGLGMTSLFLVFTPLALWQPEWVNRWFETPNLQPFGHGWIVDSLNVLLAVVVAPLVEELLFRFYLFRRWSEKRSIYWGAVASSALFALLHSHILGAFLIGLILCVVYWKTRSLWACIVIHALNNAIVCFFMVLTQDDQRSIALSLQQDWWQGVLAASLSIPLLIVMLRYLGWSKNSTLGKVAKSTLSDAN